MDEDSVWQALGVLLRSPATLVRRWNSKAALISAICRGFVFLAASLHVHTGGHATAALAEAIYGAVNAGFCGAITQKLRFARPRWIAVFLLAGIFPVIFQVGEVSLHHALGTQVLRASLIASTVMTALSALFNLYVMRRGALLIGAGSRPLLHDIAALPLLAWSFVTEGFPGAIRLFTSA